MDNLKPPVLVEANGAQKDDLKHKEDIRLSSRSPHPYHRRNSELLEPSGHFVPRASAVPAHQAEDVHNQLLSSPRFAKDATPESDSGTEADDELYFKRLPAPKTNLHKGLRRRNGVPSESSTPLLTPTIGEFDHDGILSRVKTRAKHEDELRKAVTIRRTREFKRRGTEVLILLVLSGLVTRNPGVKAVVILWKDALQSQCALYATLLLLYPIRVAIRAFWTGQPLKGSIPFSVPSSFDPAPLLYPQLLPVLVAFLTAANVRDVVLPNLVLSIASIPAPLIPFSDVFEAINPLHWFFTILPLMSYQTSPSVDIFGSPQGSTLSTEELTWLYPLQHNLSLLLRLLVKESLLPAEHELLSISLLNLLVLSTSPQAVILRALLWIGGIGVILLCGPVIRWSIRLSTVRPWRFRRNKDSSRTYRTWMLAYIDGFFLFVMNIFSGKPTKDAGSETEDSVAVSCYTTDEDNKSAYPSRRRSMSLHLDSQYECESMSRAKTASVLSANEDHIRLGDSETLPISIHSRRRTLPFAQSMMKPSKTHTPSGRPKRSVSASIRVFYGLTREGAAVRKWEYAMWVYFAIIAVIFGVIPWFMFSNIPTWLDHVGRVLGGVRWHVQRYALGGEDPVGWALGYIFGNIQPARMWVVTTPSLSRWICLPDFPNKDDDDYHYLGWAEHLRYASYGEATTRLFLAAYWIFVIIIGLTLVVRLTSYEVDTRRKVFHFMMVFMFLPTIYIDPTWCALALALVLSIFLLLDLLRASQLPPLSRPISNFLAPYTDGRDYNGPVVISHIFLLIGCAIPLWLSLASLPRSGTGMLSGWEIPTRETSMVTGVVCVGLGDAAASLCGRRWGRHKWCWKGGKSLEGSAAFAGAVFIGLTAANWWLNWGEWAITGHQEAPRVSEGLVAGLKAWNTPSTLTKTGMCASLASLTEAVLTGGNDNVVVPVVLWTCVKSTGL